MRRFIVASSVGTIVVALAVLGVSLFGHTNQTTSASTPITVGFDMNVAGNTCPGTGVADCVLGPIDTCVQIGGPSTITVDVYL